MFRAILREVVYASVVLVMYALVLGWGLSTPHLSAWRVAGMVSIIGIGVLITVLTLIYGIRRHLRNRPFFEAAEPLQEALNHLELPLYETRIFTNPNGREQRVYRTWSRWEFRDIDGGKYYSLRVGEYVHNHSNYKPASIKVVNQLIKIVQSGDISITR